MTMKYLWLTNVECMGYIQKTAAKQLVHQVFPKLAVYSSVDPSLAPSLLAV